MKKEIIAVTGMSCKHCEKRVADALAALEGVKKSKPDAKNNRVSVVYDETVVSGAAVREAIVAAGYGVAE